jgi:PAS domain S-box-containing protein
MLQPTQCTQAATLHVQVFVCDAEGRVAEWNPCLATLTGTEADECLGKPLAGRVAEDQADLVRQLFASPAESEAVLRMLCADGSQLSISFALAHYDVDAATATAATAAAAPAAATATAAATTAAAAAAAAAAVSAAAAAATAAARARGGAAAAAGPSPPRRGVLGVGKDVSTLATAVAAATQEVHDLKRLIDGANAPIFGINAASLITEWNRKATAITGRSKWEVVGRRLEEFINPEDRESVVEVLENALRGKETANFGFPLYTKAGDRVEILLNASTRRDAKGNICGVISVGQDITELMRGKKELASVANDLRMLIESANAPIFGVDNAGRVTEWNSKASHRKE